MSKRRPDTEPQELDQHAFGSIEQFGRDAATEIGKGFSLFRLALKNMGTYAWMNVKMCLTFACLAFLICLFTVYNAAINQRKTEFERDSASANLMITQSATAASLIEERWPNAKKDLYYLHNFSSDISARFGVGGKFLGDSSFFVLEVEGEQYAASKSVSFCTVAHPEEAYFTQGDQTELESRFGESSFFLTGEYPAEKEDIALGLPLLEAYRLEPDDVMGKTISVYLKDPRDGKPPLSFQFSGKVSGVVREEFYSLTGHKDTNMRPSFFMRYENDFFKDKRLVRYRYILPDWPTYEEYRTWKQSFTDTTFLYAGLTSVDKVDVLNSLQILATNLYIIVGSALGVGLVLTVFLMIDKYIKVFARSGGILLSVGMRRSQLFGLLFLQLFLLCVAAIPLSFVFTIGGYFVINLLVKWITDISLSIAFRKLVKMLFLGVLVVIGIAFAFFAYAIICIRNRTIKDYLGVVID